MALPPNIVPLEITVRRSSPSIQQFAPDATADPNAGGNDDPATDYILARNQADSEALERRAREKYGVAPVQATPPGPASTPGPAGAAPAVPATPPASPAPAAATGFGQGDLVEDVKAMGRGVVNIGSELVRAPAAIGAGIGGAGSELFHAADSLATWLNDKVPLTFKVPPTGSETVDSLLANPAKAVAGMIDAITPSAGKSVTAPMIKEVSQFLTGMAIGGKLFKGIGAFAEGVGGATGTATKALATGAVSDLLMMDPKEENLAALLKKVPALDGPVTTFLATNPDDNEAVNRLRRAVEGLGLGLATEGLLQAFRVYRAARAAQRSESAPKPVDALAEQRVKYGELKETDLAAKLGGDPSAEAKLVEFGKKTEGIEPTTLAGDPSRTPRVVATKEEQERILREEWRLHGPELDHEDLPHSIWTREAKAWNKKHGTTIDPDDYRFGTVPEFEQMFDAKHLAGKKPPFPGVKKANEYFEEHAFVTDDAPLRGAYLKGREPREFMHEADEAAEAIEALKAEPKPGRGDLPEGGIAINWARISTADDVKLVMRQMADHLKAEIDSARRGRITQEETAKLADDLGMTVDQLLLRREGQAFNAEETLAARQMLTAATEKLLEAAKAAAAPNAGPVDLFAFRRMLATQAAIQNEVLAARAEAGRALNAWKIPAAAKGDVERSRAVLEALEGGGGEEIARDLARRIGMLADTGADAAGMNAVVRKSATATTWNVVSEVWINALLSNPKTHLVNIASNSLALGQQVLERGIAEKWAAAMRAEGAALDGVVPGEAAAMMQAVVSAQKDAWKTAWLALKSGETGHAIGKVETPHAAAVSAETFRLEGTQLGRVVDLLGTVERVPGRLLGTADEYFKTIGYRMEVFAQAQRQATSEGLSGEALRTRFAELVANPPEHIRLAAIDAALYATFTSKAGGAAQALIKLREAVPAVTFILPFVKTPANIVHYSFERTPLAPLMASYQADIAAGGARAELARTRMATGTSIMLMAADYADRGLVTGKGPADPGKREALERQGWKPYSIRSGDRWIGYDRLDPYGMLFGFAADMAEFSRRLEIDGDKIDEFSEIWAAGIAAVSQTTINKTYLQGVADFAWMIEDPKRRAFDYLGREVGTVVPAGVNMVRQLGDPVAREHMKIWDFVQGRLPGFSEGLTPSRDLWGKEKRPDSGFGPWYDALSPAAVSRIKASPVDAEMGRLNMGVERIEKRATVDGVPMNFRDWPAVYDRYVVLAGNEAKNPAYGNMGAKDFLDAVVSGKQPWAGMVDYAKLGEGPDGAKADFIRATIAQYRKTAQAAILADPAFKDFQKAWREQRDIVAQQRTRRIDVPQMPTPNIQRPMPPGVQPMTPPAGAAPPPTISPMRAP